MSRQSIRSIQKIPLVVIALVLTVMTCASYVQTASAESYSPHTGAIFNNPTGNHAQQYRIIYSIEDAINAAPKGSFIRVAMYSNNVPTTVDSLIRAHKRGVSIKYLTDDHASSTPETKRLIAALGTKVTTGAGSYVKICHLSCFNNYPISYMHAKFFLFSTSGSSKLVSMVTSSNFSTTQAQVGWNNIYTTVGNHVVYNSLRDYFVAMTADKTNPSPYVRADGGVIRSYVFPRFDKVADDRYSDNFYDAFKYISCNKPASGYGSGSTTNVDVAMYQWSQKRLYLAQVLWNLDNAGCNVRVMYSGTNIEKPVKAALLKTGGKHGGITVRDTDVDANRDGIPEIYMHNKYILINGIYYGDKSSKVVFTGSANFTRVGLRYNSEVDIRLTSPTAYAQYLGNYQQIWARAKPVTSYKASLSVPTAATSVAGVAAPADTTKDYEVETDE